jgi:hypothetical protein
MLKKLIFKILEHILEQLNQLAFNSSSYYRVEILIPLKMRFQTILFPMTLVLGLPCILASAIQESNSAQVVMTPNDFGIKNLMRESHSPEL